MNTGCCCFVVGASHTVQCLAAIRPIQGCGGCTALPSQACLSTFAPHLVGAAVRQRVELVGQVLHAHQLVDLEGDGVALQAAAAAQQGWVMLGAAAKRQLVGQRPGHTSCGLASTSMDRVEEPSWQLLHRISELPTESECPTEPHSRRVPPRLRSAPS